MRILSGVQPSGRLHLGNYFGAIAQHLALQEEAPGECFYFIADYHALTSTHDAKALRAYSHEVAVAYLALGLDPEKAIFYRQSDLPEVTELAWMLACVTGMGLLERAHSYKDKVGKGVRASAGLFTYPLLMAADILIVRPDFVPVGQDQVQHIEMTQDMAQSFNAAFSCDVLKRPESRLSKTPKVPGTDGEKMSKSYGNTIDIFAEGKTLKKSVMGVVTQPIDLGQPLPVEGDTVLELHRLFASAEQMQELEEAYRTGSVGYGDAKKLLLERVDSQFAPAREKRRELEADPGYVEDVLADGARRAREIGRALVAECREAVGLRRLLP